jgi:hypothetical protein
MNDLSGTVDDAGPTAAIIANGHDVALVIAARKLVETTTLSQAKIAAQLGLSATVLSKLKLQEGWVRPEGAPAGPRYGAGVWRTLAEPAQVARRRLRLIARLYLACEHQLKAVEARLADAAAVIEEKDVRVLGLLAKTLETLMALERDDGVKMQAAEPVDREHLNADLVRRIRRWAQGGEGSS